MAKDVVVTVRETVTRTFVFRGRIPNEFSRHRNRTTNELPRGSTLLDVELDSRIIDHLYHHTPQMPPAREQRIERTIVGYEEHDVIPDQIDTGRVVALVENRLAYLQLSWPEMDHELHVYNIETTNPHVREKFNHSFGDTPPLWANQEVIDRLITKGYTIKARPGFADQENRRQIPDGWVLQIAS